MARTFESVKLQIDPSLEISKNLNFDPRAIVLLRTFPRYQERLQTFTPTKWHSKPACLSPPFCALYGWEIFEADTLKCESCEELLYAQLPPRNSEHFPNRVDRILTGLITQHDELCEFRQKHEPFEFFKRDDSTYLLKTRLLSFPAECKLPSVVNTIDGDVMNQLRPYCETFVKNKDQLDVIISLAMNGWNFQKSEDYPMGNLECEDDVRVVPAG